MVRGPVCTDRNFYKRFDEAEQTAIRYVSANMLNLFSAYVGHGSPLAYIDGGTGSMLLQAAIAGVLTGLYAAKNRIGQLRALFAQRSNNKTNDR
jgi:hypothetical protein